MAGTTTKGIDLWRSQKTFFEKNLLTAQQGHEALSEEGEKDLKEMLSGTLTPRQTRGSFARGASSAVATPTGRRRALTARQRKNRGLRGSVPLNPINKQSGRLYRGVSLRRAATLAALQELNLVIDGVDYAKYILAVGGTEKMVARQVQAVLRKRFGPRNKAFFDHFVRSSGGT